MKFNPVNKLSNKLKTLPAWGGWIEIYGNTAQKSKTKPNYDIMNAWINR